MANTEKEAMTVKQTVILINLGTPDGPDVPAVRRYLREFLMDPRIINIPALLRWLLVHLVILPLRPKKSAKAYQKVWTAEGSPLMVHGLRLRDKVQESLGPNFNVLLAMRYGQPSIQSAVDQAVSSAAGEVVAFPLYPQYAAATTGSTVEKIFSCLEKQWNVPPITVIKDFYDDPRFIRAVAAVTADHLQGFAADHILFSYHGLPESHLHDTARQCLKDETCCSAVTASNRFCYRAQCMATTRAIAQALDLTPDRWTVSFQSRLGRAEWVKPYTTDTIEKLARSGVKKLAVLCPAFVADCLETIEEIGMEAKADFIAAGGEDLYLVPCVNSDDRWASAVTAIVRDHLPQQTSGVAKL